MTKDPSIVKTCFWVYVIKSYVEEVFQQQHPQDPLEASLIRKVDSNEEDSELVAFTNTLNEQHILPHGKSLRYEPLPICHVYTLKEEDTPKVKLK